MSVKIENYPYHIDSINLEKIFNNLWIYQFDGKITEIYSTLFVFSKQPAYLGFLCTVNNVIVIDNEQSIENIDVQVVRVGNMYYFKDKDFLFNLKLLS